MFENLTDKLQEAFKKFRKGGKLSEADIKDGLRSIRVALLEADVALDVVKTFIKSIREKAIGEAVIGSVKPGEQIVKMVQDELISMMGESDTLVPYKENGATVILLSGLQGSGKTTTCGKLAHFLSKRDHRKVLMVAADTYRPAAVDQLKTVGAELGIDVYSEDVSSAISICENSLKHAAQNGHDLIILDTAGRLHVDEEMMREIRVISERTRPDQTYLVCDAMTGQDAVQSARAFHETLSLDGVILTKLDGDTRGGAALSLRHVTGKPIKFAGVGEQLNKLEEFHPDRMASRILGMGDVVSLVEKAQDAISEEEAMVLQEKILKNKFTLEDFLGQLRMIKKMGSIKDLMGMIPGIGAAVKDMDVDEKQFTRIEALILSMTVEERRKVETLDGSRRKRIALGAGQTVQEFNQFLTQYKMMQKMMSGMGKGMMGGMKGMMGGLGKKLMGGGGGAAPAGMADMMEGMDGGGGLDLPMSREDHKKLRELKKSKKAKRKRSRGK